jgi:hypothetical protein
MSMDKILANIVENGKNDYLWATIAGLLSSSCCVIQLGLNAMSLGCAGFSILTPYRYFK